MKKVFLAACAVALTVGGFAPVGVLPAGAEPASASTALGYGANVELAGTEVVDRAGLATATLPPGQDAGPTDLLLVPADPVAVSGTARGQANAHVNADITTALITANQQSVPGPYNVRAQGLVENLDVGLSALGVPVPGVPSLVEAGAVRGEAVGVCRGGAPVYSAQSETVGLRVGGTDVGLNGPIEGVIDALNTVLAPLASVVDIERNEVSALPGGGIQVNALHVTVAGSLAAPGEPLLDLIIGHAEVGGLTCAPVAQCSDTQDNDGDGLIDANDPGCLTPDGVYDPNDNDERNECIDGIDNTDPEDNLVDFGSDPGCSSPEDDDETDDLPQTTGGGGELARTGGNGSTTVPVAGGVAILALGALALRRRSQASS